MTVALSNSAPSAWEYVLSLPRTLRPTRKLQL